MDSAVLRDTVAAATELHRSPRGAGTLSLQTTEKLYANNARDIAVGTGVAAAVTTHTEPLALLDCIRPERYLLISTLYGLPSREEHWLCGFFRLHKTYDERCKEVWSSMQRYN